MLLLDISREIWMVTAEMAPYLLFGFLAAGVLSQLISREYVRAHLGGRGLLGSIKAALIGVPMPICSCGVIPLAASLREHGASRGATASFLASTPQTGVDSLMITYALLGWAFAVVRALAAFVSGVACGAAVTMASPHEDLEAVATEPETTEPKPHLAIRMLRHGFIVLPRNIAKALVMGIVISGVLSALVPENFFADKLGDSPAAMLAMLVIGIPLYVCSSASVPIALAFIKAGLSPGAALVFLITGPATNAATLTTLWKIIGKRQLVVFLATLAACALAAGFLLNGLAPTLGVADQICHSEPSSSAGNLWAGILLVVILRALMPSKPSPPRGNRKQHAIST